jgi:predicted anti-sigma-YlaC factor YlaD
MTASDDLTCKEVVEIVTDYLEGKMPTDLRARFEAHLLSCSGCRTYLEQMRQTIRLAGKLSESQLSPDAQETLLKAFRNWKKREEMNG